MKFIEKIAAFVFLLIIIGLLIFFTYVEIPKESKQIILVIIGVLMGEATKALPRLFGSNEDERKSLESRIDKLEHELKVAQSKYETLELHHNQLMQALIEHHVIYDKINLEVNK